MDDDGVRHVHVVFGGKDIGEVVEDAACLPNVEEGITGQPGVDKGRLHTRQHPGDPALVEVANHR